MKNDLQLVYSQFNQAEPQNIIINDWGVYGVSELESLIPIFKELKGKLLDLGSGTGEVVNLAILNNLDAYGVEIDKKLFSKSYKINKIFNKDMFDLNWNEYNILYYYICGCRNQTQIKEKLKTFKGLFILHINRVNINEIYKFEKDLPLKRFKIFPMNILYGN